MLGLERCGFELHPGGTSLGCITADKTNANTMNQYNTVNTLLNREVGSNTLTVCHEEIISIDIIGCHSCPFRSGLVYITKFPNGSRGTGV